MEGLLGAGQRAEHWNTTATRAALLDLSWIPSRRASDANSAESLPSSSIKLKSPTQTRESHFGFAGYGAGCRRAHVRPSQKWVPCPGLT